jgi:nucleoside-diphosphate-sugar epimerase
LVEISGRAPGTTPGPKRPGDCRDAQFDPALAASELGWHPEVGLLDGMRETYDYFATLKV